jgi:polar amino acid transport system substrate-binding protein/two-component system sensor histidine kinase EvgS
LKIRQILINLISNAYKFTEEGEVNVEIQSKKEMRVQQKINVDVVIRVTDTGIGIPKEYQETIFEAFKQHEEQDSRKFGGTGLGLAITTRLVELMNGSIKLTSEQGKGSTFEITIPNVESGLTLNVKPRTKSRKYIRFQNAKILIVDDVLSNRELLKGAIKGKEIEFSEASNGKKALDILKKEKPDVVLLDLNLPLVNGFDVAKYIKNSSRLKEVPIIAISAFHTINQYDDYAKYFDVFLSKPFDVNVLLEHLRQYIPYIEDELKEKKTIKHAKKHKDISFNMENKEDLLRDIEKLFNDYNKVKDTSSFLEFKEFSLRLKKVAKKHKIELLNVTANKIIKASDNFDIDEMNQYLYQVHSILNEINEKVKEISN